MHWNGSRDFLSAPCSSSIPAPPSSMSGPCTWTETSTQRCLQSRRSAQMRTGRSLVVTASSSRRSSSQTMANRSTPGSASGATPALPQPSACSATLPGSSRACMRRTSCTGTSTRRASCGAPSTTRGPSQTSDVLTVLVPPPPLCVVVVINHSCSTTTTH
jgi:hypothetical protein